MIEFGFTIEPCDEKSPIIEDLIIDGNFFSFFFFSIFFRVIVDILVA